MTLQIIIGTQWGDEGKGRFVDLLSADAQYVARYSGGDNAGHTLRIQDHVYKLHLIPSGIIYPRTTGILGNGMVINPRVLLREINELKDAGIHLSPDRLKISYAAHLITPAHQVLDTAREAHLGKSKIGTTGRGIGPAYTDKARRVGLRALDMLDPAAFSEKMKQNLEQKNEELKLYGAEPLDIPAIVDEFRGYADLISPYIADTSAILYDALKADQKVIAEGAQGALLDIDFGTYPYVTSSSCVAGNAMVGLGIGVPNLVHTTGITKVFQTRVGEGPFPTELFDETSHLLRGDGSKQWDEFGTTTGRPRRVGWLDAVLLKKVIQMNGVNELALTKLDVLSNLPEVKICTAYQGGSTVSPLVLDNVIQPHYHSFKGWSGDLMGVRQWEELPAEARDYVLFIEEYCQTPVRYISVGPERSQLIKRF
jgi:adenylosuccinate synthase